MTRSILFGAVVLSAVVCWMTAGDLFRPIDDGPERTKSARGPIPRHAPRPADAGRLRLPGESAPAPRLAAFLDEIASLVDDAPEAEFERLTSQIVRCGDANLRDAMLRAIPDRNRRENFLQRVALRLAKRDPAAAAAWLRDLEIDADRAPALAALGRQWAQTAPASAADFARALPEGRLRRDPLAATFAAWIGREPAAAMRWAGQLPEHADFDPVAAAIARSPDCLEQNFAQTLNWAESIQNDELRKQSVGIAMQAWAERDTASARGYLESCPALTAFQRDALLEDLSLR